MPPKRTPDIIIIDEFIDIFDRDMIEKIEEIRRINKIKTSLDEERDNTKDVYEIARNDEQFALLDEMGESVAQQIALLKLQISKLFKKRDELNRSLQQG